MFALLLSSVCEWEQYWFPGKEPSARVGERREGQGQEVVIAGTATKNASYLPKKHNNYIYGTIAGVSYRTEAIQIKRYLCSSIAAVQYWVLIADNLNNIGFFAPNTYARTSAWAD